LFAILSPRTADDIEAVVSFIKQALKKGGFIIFFVHVYFDSPFSD
jgi:hypothetical protein